MREAAKSCGKLLKAVKTCGREHEKGGKEKPDAFFCARCGLEAYFFSSRAQARV